MPRDAGKVAWNVLATSAERSHSGQVALPHCHTPDVPVHGQHHLNVGSATLARRVSPLLGDGHACAKETHGERTAKNRAPTEDLVEPVVDGPIGTAVGAKGSSLRSLPSGAQIQKF